jgi:hypothetical protein
MHATRRTPPSSVSYIVEKDYNGCLFHQGLLVNKRKHRHRPITLYKVSGVEAGVKHRQSMQPKFKSIYMQMKLRLEL